MILFREAVLADITQIQIVRNSVTENTLSNPAVVSDKDCEEYLAVRGKGWVAEIENKVAGFAIADLAEHNIWALFVHPAHEAKGIGKKLHDLMLDWYFTQTITPVWLGTAFNTRAETFYRMQGWQEVGTNGPKEIKFEMTIEKWQSG